MKLYDAARCPYCARVRLVLAEKGCAFEAVEIDLAQRPQWLLELNSSGRVPVLEDGFVLPESAVIMEYLEECFPVPALLPDEQASRALARLAILRFDALLGDDYYAHRRGRPSELASRLDQLPIGLGLLSDFAYVPWVIRLRELYAVELPDAVERWLEGLAGRPSVAREIELVRGLR